MIAYCINARLYSILTDFFFLAMLKSENNIFTLYKDLNCYLRDPNVTVTVTLVAVVHILNAR